MESFTHNRQHLLEQQRQQLERTFRQNARPTVDRPARLQQLINRAGKALVHWLTAGNAPRISLSTQGETQVWKVYDPIDNSTYYFDEENQVRDWLDHRFYQ